MVRLDADKTIKEAMTGMSFNSNMVRLDESGLLHLVEALMCFNSNMVRLDVASDIVSILIRLFQFQYGVIRCRRIKG